MKAPNIDTRYERPKKLTEEEKAALEAEEDEAIEQRREESYKIGTQEIANAEPVDWTVHVNGKPAFRFQEGNPHIVTAVFILLDFFMLYGDNQNWEAGRNLMLGDDQGNAIEIATRFTRADAPVTILSPGVIVATHELLSGRGGGGREDLRYLLEYHNFPMTKDEDDLYWETRSCRPFIWDLRTSAMWVLASHLLPATVDPDAAAPVQQEIEGLLFVQDKWGREFAPGCRNANSSMCVAFRREWDDPIFSEDYVDILHELSGMSKQAEFDIGRFYPISEERPDAFDIVDDAAGWEWLAVNPSLTVDQAKVILREVVSDLSRKNNYYFGDLF